MVEELPVPLADRYVTIELADVSSDIRNRFGVGQMMAIREVLHPQIPRPVVTIIHELLYEHRCVLSGDAWNPTIARAASMRSMASDAWFKELRSTIEIRLTTSCLHELLLARGNGANTINKKHRPHTEGE